MSREYISQVAGLETVGQVRAALANYPDDMPIGDMFGEPLILNLVKDLDTEDLELEFN